MNARSLRCPIGVACLLVAGCGGGNFPAHENAAAYTPPSREDLELAKAVEPVAADGNPAGESPPAAGHGATAAETATAKLDRKIIYTGNLQLQVMDFDPLPAQIEQLTVQHGGYVASSSVGGSNGQSRTGTWTVRIPVARYGDFLQAAGQLGKMIQQAITSREVTAEFYDLQARAENKQREEARLLAHLESIVDKLTDILAIEKELSRVRGEIEQLQGQFRLLENLTAMSTLTLTVREVQQYVAPTPYIPPTFAARVVAAWHGSLGRMIQAGQEVAIGVVILGPWLIVLAVFMTPVLFLIWRMLSSGRRLRSA